MSGATGLIFRAFLSTLSLRRATPIVPAELVTLVFLSTLSLRRATPALYQLYDTYAISIHALLAESDAPNRHPCPRSRNFYPRSPCGERRRLPINDGIALQFLSTLSLRRATFVGASEGAAVEHISIHALLAESDSQAL